MPFIRDFCPLNSPDTRGCSFGSLLKSIVSSCFRRSWCDRDIPGSAGSSCDKRRWNTQLTCRAGEFFRRVFPHRLLLQKTVNVVRIDRAEWSNDMKLSRTTAESILESRCNRSFSVLHARRDFRKQDVTVREVRVALANVGKGTFRSSIEVGA